MVVLGFVRRNSDCSMRRSKTSVQLKANSSRRPSLQLKSPCFWNVAYIDHKSPLEKSFQTPRPETASHASHRRKSIACTFRTWELANATKGMEDIKVIETSDNTREGTKKASNFFPPISAQPMRNPRMLSAKSTARRQKSLNCAERPSPRQNGFDHSVSKSNSMLSSECERYSLDPVSPLRAQSTFSFGSKKDSDAEMHHPLPSRPAVTKTKSSSLRSRSSEESSSSAVLNAKASPRRFSMPVVPSSFVLAKSKEFYKAVKELSKQEDDFGVKMNRSQTTTSAMVLSDKVSILASSSTPRDALSIPTRKCRDSLQRIEEVPLETGAPVLTVNEEAKEEPLVQDNGDVTQTDNDATGTNVDPDSKAIVACENGDELRAGQPSATPGAADAIVIEPCCDDIIRNNGEDEDKTHEEQTNDFDRTAPPLNKKTLNGFTKPIPTKAAVIMAYSIFDEDDSVIDDSILYEDDDDLCDADFREKRIIQWIKAAETGLNGEQKVESAICPSPKLGSRETAITVIYNG